MSEGGWSGEGEPRLAPRVSGHPRGLIQPPPVTLPARSGTPPGLGHPGNRGRTWAEATSVPKRASDSKAATATRGRRVRTGRQGTPPGRPPLRSDRVDDRALRVLLAKGERELGGERGGRTIAGLWEVTVAIPTAMGAYLGGPTGRLASLTPLPRILTRGRTGVWRALSIRLAAPSACAR